MGRSAKINRSATHIQQKRAAKGQAPKVNKKREARLALKERHRDETRVFAGTGDASMQENPSAAEGEMSAEMSTAMWGPRRRFIVAATDKSGYWEAFDPNHPYKNCADLFANCFSSAVCLSYSVRDDSTVSFVLGDGGAERLPMTVLTLNSKFYGKLRERNQRATEKAVIQQMRRALNPSEERVEGSVIHRMPVNVEISSKRMWRGLLSDMDRKKDVGVKHLLYLTEEGQPIAKWMEHVSPQRKLVTDVVAVLGGQTDVTAGEIASLKKVLKEMEGWELHPVSLGPSSMQAKDCITVLHNQLDMLAGGMAE